MNATEKDNVFYCDCGFSWRRGMSGSHNCEDGLRAKLTDMAVQLANAESKCRDLAAENAVLKDGVNKAIEDIQCFYDSYGWHVSEDGESETAVVALDDAKGSIEHFALSVKTPMTDAFLAEVRASAISEGYVLVPQQIFLDPSDIESICSQCGDGHESGYGDFTDGLLWVGNIQRDDGSIVHGLHISSADYTEEGGVTIYEFADQLCKGVEL
ncbi:TPA: hypothetical protein ACTYZW_001295 [Citrobacter freundii]|uniref:hypothetical protein n=1 Tax=Citrobacter freundii TaxID=546 RepID=UPI001F4F513D|nr:hypothetical protein [Citrobacter freundii]